MLKEPLYRLTNGRRDASVRAHLNSYMSGLQQVQTYLPNDLTPQVMSAISSIAEAVERDGAKGCL